MGFEFGFGICSKEPQPTKGCTLEWISKTDFVTKLPL